MEATTDEIRGIIKGLKPDKAPGPDQITNRLLKLIAETIAPTLAQIVSDCLKLGYFPDQFKTADTIMLKKPGQDKKPSEPKSYRPIALLNTIGKVIETTIANRLRNGLEDNNKLPDTQMGARRNSSTASALELVTETVHTIWQKGQGLYVATALSLDIAGAFDNVSHPRLISNLRKKGAPEQLVKAIESFLERRTSTISITGYTSELMNVEAGIPQGSVLSPILFLVFAAGLLEVTHKPLQRKIALGFVDDTTLIAYGKTTKDTCRQLETVHEECLKWADKHGAKFAPAKYELIHFTRRPKKFDMKQGVRIGQTVVKLEPLVRILGAHLDTGLKWDGHIAKINV